MSAKHACNIILLGCSTVMLVCSTHTALLVASVLMSFGSMVMRDCISAQAELQRGSSQHAIFEMLDCTVIILLTLGEEHT